MFDSLLHLEQTMNTEPWYAAQCIFRHTDAGRGPKQTYEERIILLRANSADEAIARAEKEAKGYCADLNDCEYLGYVSVFHLFDDAPGDGTEIFSSMQRSDLTAKEYLDRHYPDVPADCEAIGETHRWHNLDGNRSGCYHCDVTRDGKLWRTDDRRIH